MQHPPKLFLIYCLMLQSVAVTNAAVDHHQAVLQSLYPAGGQQGTEVEVTFSTENGGLDKATGLVIDGPPGLSVKKFEAVNAAQAKATLTIAADAAPGRRMIRVRGGSTGLTNFRWFFVGTLAEHIESKINNEISQADDIATPLVVNGRIEKTLDQDCYRFQASKGQSLVLAVQSHWLDAMGYDRKNAGFADATLELLNEKGSILAEASDTLGYDPLIHHTIPADGTYIARISGMGYKGFPQFVYRLTIGAIPYPTAVSPPGGKRGSKIEVTFSGPNVPEGTKRTIKITEDGSEVQYVLLDGATPGLPLLRSDMPEITPADPSDDIKQALRLSESAVVVNGCFEKPGDVDCFQVELKKREKIALDVLAQRHLRAPVDTLLQVFDAKGRKLAENDDSELLVSEVLHEFVPFDSQIVFEAKTAGSYFIRVSDQSGSGSPRSVYRLTKSNYDPDFKLYQWPDAVAVWGPGSTAGFVVEIQRFGNLKTDVDITVENLPDGWIGSTTTAFAADYRPAVRPAFGHKVLLTITAPPDTPVGSIVDFEVVGRAKTEQGELVHTALPLTQLAWGEPNRFRAGVKSRAVVTRPQGLPIETNVTTLTVKPASKVEIPLTVPEFAMPPDKPVRLSINRAGTHFKCAISAPVKVNLATRRGTVQFPLPKGYQAGQSYDVLISNAWSSETRKGLPGPCTRLVRLEVSDQ